MDAKDVMTTEMVADYLNLSVEEVTKLVENKDIPCAKIAGKLLFVRQQLLEWLSHNATKEPSKWDEPEDEEKD